jgi:chromosome segregation protein
LDKERSQALRFKELETIIKRLKFSILTKNIESKQAELDSIEKSIGSKTGQKGKIQKEIEEIQRAMDNLSERINQINRHIQEVAGVEQETLHNQVANLKVEIEGIKVRKENFENRAHEIERRIKEMSKSIPEIQLEINGLKEKSPGMAKKSLDLKKKKEELAEIEEERKKALTLKTELNSLNERIKDKERQLSRLNAESESLLKQIEEYSLNLDYSDKEQSAKAIQKLKELMHSKRKEVDELQKNELKNEKIASISDSEITRLEKIRSQVQKIDICPLCQSKITPEHVNHVSQEASEAIKKEKAKFGEAQRELEIINSSKEKIWKEIQAIGDKISLAETGLIKQRALEEKKEQLKKVLENEGIVKGEIRSLEGKIRGIEDKSLDFVKISENYDSKMLEIEEISSRTEEDIDTTLLYKERDLEQIKNIIERSKQDAGEINVRIEEFSESLKRKTFELVQKEEQERKLNEKFKKMFEERDSIQKSIQEKNIIILESQNNSRQIDDQINMLRIAKAKLDAEKESLEAETANCSGVEAINASFNALTERLAKSQEAIQQIGPINLRAVEVYESVKKEYDAVQEKVNVLEKEKQDILKIIEEIDTKKTRSFMKTFKAINTLFTRNFSQLSAKGIAFLEIENKEDIFSEGVNIVVKLAKGKFFDVTSLSGGEQTLVALSLLFAIQEFKPYHFYIFDEIDAALDKRNSERLANLLNQFMKSGQYIVITHNDAIIMNSNVLYGVSMHEGVSKILSIEIGEHLPSRMLDNEQQQQTSQNERVAQAP